MALVKKVFPQATVLVGGIYPTLAPQHAVEHLGADLIFKGELREASQLPTDLTLYTTPPSYAILATSRGCPWDCVYCAARTLNGGAKVRTRTTEDILEEIRYKCTHLGIRRFGFYEDNALIHREHFIEVMEEIIASGLSLDLYAPEGFETLYWLLGSSVQKQALRDRERSPSLLANAGGLVYNQQSSTACSCSNDDTLI